MLEELLQESKEARIDRLGIANAISLIANQPLGYSLKGITEALDNIRVNGVHLEDLTPPLRQMVAIKGYGSVDKEDVEARRNKIGL